jgi:hypothetical protein
MVICHNKLNFFLNHNIIIIVYLFGKVEYGIKFCLHEKQEENP